MAKRRRTVSGVTLSGLDYELFLHVPEAVVRNGHPPEDSSFSDAGFDALGTLWRAQFDTADRQELRGIIYRYLVLLESEKRAASLDGAKARAASVAAKANTLMAEIARPASVGGSSAADAAAEALALVDDEFLERQATSVGGHAHTLDDLWHILLRLAEAALAAERALDKNTKTDKTDEWAAGHAWRILEGEITAFGQSRGLHTAASNTTGQDGSALGPFVAFLSALNSRLPTAWRFCHGDVGAVAQAVNTSRRRRSAAPRGRGPRREE